MEVQNIEYYDIMKYQDSSTRPQYTKIHSLLSRLKPSRLPTKLFHTESNSRSAIHSSNTFRSRLHKQQKQHPLEVDVLHHRTHSLMVFIPSLNEPIRGTTANERNFQSRDIKLLKTVSSKFSSITQATSVRSSFRIKKRAISKQDTECKQNRARAPSLLESPKPKLQQSKILKDSAVIKQEQISTADDKKEKEDKKPKKPKTTREVKPPIEKYLINHKTLNQLQQRFKLNQQKLYQSDQPSKYLIVRDVLESKGNLLFTASGNERVNCQDPSVSFLLNTLFSHNPNIIKKLFGQIGNETIRLILNYEGCFRALSINCLGVQNNDRFISSEINSLWPRILDQALSTLFKTKSLHFVSIKSLYEMLTGLVLQQIEIKDCSPEKLFQIVSGLNSHSVIFGETSDSELSLISCNGDSLHVKRHVVQSVYSEFQPSRQILVAYLQQHYKTIYLADLYPEYYFIYKKIEYSLGNDSVIRLDVPEQTTMILQISTQTIAFDGKVKLCLQQKREEGVQECYSTLIKSSSGVKKQLKLLSGVYWLRLSDEKENMREHRLSIVVGIACRKDISKWIKEFD